jgi:hypothetical protein
MGIEMIMANKMGAGNSQRGFGAEAESKSKLGPMSTKSQA